MHRRATSLVTVSLVAALLGAAAGVVARPTAGAAQDTRESRQAREAQVPGSGLGRFQLVLLPTGYGEPRQWILLDTQTGVVEHWHERPDEYAAHIGIRNGRTGSTDYYRLRKSLAGR